MSSWNPFDPAFWSPSANAATEVRSTGAVSAVRSGVQSVQVNDAARAASRPDVIYVAKNHGAVRE